MPKIEITTAIGCKISCSYCPQDILKKAYLKRSDTLQLDFATFKTCLDKIPSHVDILFCGFSEPWLNSGCADMVLYASKKGHKIQVYTTLVNMSLQDVELLEKCPINDLCVHLPSANRHEQITIDEEYLKVLKRVSESKINTTFHSHMEEVPREVKQVLDKDAPVYSLCTRAGNLRTDSASLSGRKKGIIGCERYLEHFVMLPNGDVVLCSMDYGLQHVLGNLLTDDFESLFHSEEYLKVKKGLRDDSSDTLCRRCDLFAYNVNIPSLFYNYRLAHALHGVKNIKNIADFFRFIGRCLMFLSKSHGDRSVHGSNKHSEKN